MLNLLANIQADTNDNVEPVDLPELLNFVIKNQFKKKLHKYIVDTPREQALKPVDDISSKIARIIDPYHDKPEEDRVKVLLFIASSSHASRFPFFHQSINNIRNYMQANQDSARLH